MPVNNMDNPFLITKNFFIPENSQKNTIMIIGLSNYDASNAIFKKNLLTPNVSKVIMDYNDTFYDYYKYKNMGNLLKIKRLDFTDEKSALSYNPFLFFKTDKDIYAFIQTIKKNFKDKSSVYSHEKEELMFLLINHVCRLRKYSFQTFLEYLRKCTTEYDNKTYMDFEINYLEETDQTRILYLNWRRKYKDSYIDIAKECLRQMESIWIPIREDEDPYLIFKNIRKTPTLLFLNMTRSKTDNHNVWAAVFCTQMLKYMQNEIHYPKDLHVQFWQMESKLYLYNFKDAIQSTSISNFTFITIEYAIIYFIRMYLKDWDDISKEYKYVYYHTGGISNQNEWMFMIKKKAKKITNLIKEDEENIPAKRRFLFGKQTNKKSCTYYRLSNLRNIISSLDNEQCLLFGNEKVIYIDEKMEK